MNKNGRSLVAVFPYLIFKDSRKMTLTARDLFWRHEAIRSHDLGGP